MLPELLIIVFSDILSQRDFKLRKVESMPVTDQEEDSLSGHLQYCACFGTIAIPFLMANGPLIQYNGLLLNSFLTLFRCRKTHLHIAVVHYNVYNVSIICCKVL